MSKISITKEQAEALHHLLNCCNFLQVFNEPEDIKKLSAGEEFLKAMKKAKAASLPEIMQEIKLCSCGM